MVYFYAYYKKVFVLVVVLLFVNQYLTAQQEPLEDIKITIVFANDPGESLQVFKTPLRYNKDFAVVLQMDYSGKDVFSKVYNYFRGFNGNPGLFYTSGVIGNNIPFKMGANIVSLNSEGKDIHDTDPENYLTWSEIQTLWAAYFDISLQGLTHPPSNDDYYEVFRSISYSKKRFNEYFYQPTFNPDIYIIPDEKYGQTSFAKTAGSLAIYSDSPYANSNPFKVTSTNSYFNFEIKRTHISNNLYNDINNLATLSQNGQHWIGTYYCSGFDKAGEITFNEFKNQMNAVEADFGKNGEDIIWVATANEVFEYLNLSRLINVNQNLNDKTLEITFSADIIPENFRYYTLTLFVSSDQIITGMNVTGASQSNYSHSYNNGKAALINLNWNGGNPQSIYKIVKEALDDAVANPDSAHCLIANDYIGMVDNADSVEKYQQILCGICTDVDFDFCTYEFDIPDDTICRGDTITLSAPADMKSYLWSNDSITQSVEVSPQTTTEYWVEVVTQDDDVSRDTLTVFVYEPPVIAASQNDTVMIPPGGEDTLWVSVYGDNISYLWNTGDTDTSIIVYSPQDEYEQAYSVLITKNYTDFQCSINKDFITQVYYESEIEFTWDTVCYGDTTTLISQISTNDSVVEVLWDLTESGNFDDAEGDTVNYVFGKYGYVLVGMRVVYASGNLDVVYNIIPVPDKPVANFYYKNACYGTTTYFYDTSTIFIGEINKWMWDFGDGTTDEYKDVTHYYQQSGSYNVIHAVSSEFGCSDTVTETISIENATQPVVMTSDGQNVNYNDSLVLPSGGVITVVVQNSTDYDSIIWNGIYKGPSLDIYNIGAYTVNCYENGCSSYITFFVVNSLNPGPGPGPSPIQPTIKPTNLFTPNNDGYNDYWVINVIGMTFPISVTVYNRYGDEVYYSGNYQNDWNGMWKGNPLPQATYYYIIKDAAGIIYKGPVTIVR
jgi:gliding motility-associated-like protein